jgi:hypothetical protein
MPTATTTKEDSSSKVVQNHPLVCLKRLKEDVTLRKRLAKKIAHDCFRASKKLEEMHTAGSIGQERAEICTQDGGYSWGIRYHHAYPHVYRHTLGVRWPDTVTGQSRLVLFRNPAWTIVGWGL